MNEVKEINSILTRRNKKTSEICIVGDKINQVDMKQEERKEIEMYDIMIDLIRRWISGAISYTLGNSIVFINMLFVKELNDSNVIAAWGLANTTYVIFISSITVGINGGIDTLVSHAYGRKDYRMCNEYYNSARIVAFLLFIPQTYFCLNADTVFSLMGQPKESSELAATYMKIILPGCLLFGLFEWLRRYLQAHGVYGPITVVWVTVCTLQMIGNYILVSVLQYGVIGIAITTSLCYASLFIGLTFYTVFYKNCIPSSFEFHIPKNVTKKVFKFLRFGIPSFAILLLEWWTYELLTFYAGWISVESQATNTIMINIEDFFSDVAQAIGFASATLVGECLGAGLPKSALRATKATLYLALGLCSIFCTGIFIFKSDLFAFYSEDEALFDNFMLVISLFVLQLFFEIFHSSFVGVISGMGYQAIGTVFDIVAYWGVMLPFSYICAFVLGYGYQGVWMGAPMGTFTGAIIYSLIIYNADWEKLAAENSEETSDD